MKTVVIMRGLPGAGKSTFAELLDPTWCATVSADDYMCDRMGNYKFDPTRLDECHAKCQDDFRDLIGNNVPLVIVDNTNLSHEERWFYTREATMHGYRVHLVTVEEDTPRDNIHGVPTHVIDRMRAKMLMDTAKNLL